MKTANREKLRVLGTSVTLLKSIKRRAEADLGVEIEYICMDGESAQRFAALNPDKFDVYDQWFHDIDLIWPTGSLQKIDINRLEYWDEITSLVKSSSESCYLEKPKGSEPANRLYVDENNNISLGPTNYITMMPTVHNADSFAMIDGNEERGESSWKFILDEKFLGRNAVNSEASIGVIELVLALTAKGEFEFKDLGNLSVGEIDQVSEYLKSRSLDKKVLKFWDTEDQVAKLFIDKSVVIATMWWQGFVALRRQGVNVNMLTPLEGYRGWFGGISISKNLEGRKLDLAYKYLNWWLSGYAGAQMTRNGAYICNPERSRQFLSKDEWRYWYLGTTTESPLVDYTGKKIIDSGERHEGGGYEERMNRIWVWNSVMDEHNYLVRKWMDILKM